VSVTKSASVQPPDRGTVLEPVTTPPPQPRSRRALLAGLLGGIGGALLGSLGRASPASAAPGDPLILGQVNSSADQGTRVNSNVNGNAFQVVQSGTGPSANGLRGDASNGTGGVFTSTNNNALFATTNHADRRGIFARNAAAHGTGAAIHADGQQNHGLIATTAHADSYAVEAVNSGTGGVGAAIKADGNQNFGVLATTANTSPTSRAVMGWATGTTGAVYGVWGESSSSTGRGVFGNAPATTGINAGVEGISNSNSGRGVRGIATRTGAGITYGVWGEARGNTGRGVYGLATSTAGAGPTIGVWGETRHSFGYGVLGEAKATSPEETYGVFGDNTSTTAGHGVFGRGFRGVQGLATSASGFGVYSSGNCHVQGNFTVSGTKAFQVDHPLDPANRYLRHHCTEGAEPLTLYSGSVALGRDGTAEVALPGVGFAATRILRLGVVLLGARLTFGDVAAVGLPALGVVVVVMAVAFAAVAVASRLARIPPGLAILLGVGTAVCGNSAIVATAPVINAKVREVGVAVATITLFGTAALLLFPLLGHAVEMPARVFGFWAGLAINDTSQVVAAAAAYSEEAVDVAVVVKLVRNALMAPLILLVAGVASRRAMRPAGATVTRSAREAFPLFLFGFLALAVLRSVGVIGEDLGATLGSAAVFLITVAIAGVGLGTRLGDLRQVGPRPFLVGLGAAAVLALVALAVAGWLYSP
jgi:uncharacterized integral membrane protein (TIGR00698 family)